MNDRSDQNIKDLVISYSAYMTALKERKDYAIVTWARCLLDDQERTGVEMIGTERLRESIKHWQPELVDLIVAYEDEHYPMGEETE